MDRFRRCGMAGLMNYPLQLFALVTGVGYIFGGWENVAVSCASFLIGYFIGSLLDKS